MDHSPRFLKLCEEVVAKVKETSIDEVAERLVKKDDFHLIDVREESEFAAGHAPGAVHMSKGVIERDIEKKIPDPATPLVLYCGGGFRSALAADAIQKMGYTNVISMDGGWSGWNQKGYPTEK